MTINVLTFINLQNKNISKHVFHKVILHLIKFL